jgi:cardiolipin synthase (CMP-forming)
MAMARTTQLSTLPNLLTASRIAAAPLLALAVLTVQPAWIAAALVVFAALTDFLDGHIARAQAEVTRLGGILDPIADKVFIVTALLLLLAEGALKGASIWAVLLIVWRELLISTLRDVVRLSGFQLRVSFIAKIKTVIQFSAIIVLYAARIPALKLEGVGQFGAILLWAAAVLTLYTGANYLWLAWRQSWK